MQTVNINIDWNSKESIKAGEKLKANLENKGYRLISNFGGMFHTVMIYTLKQTKPTGNNS